MSFSQTGPFCLLVKEYFVLGIKVAFYFSINVGSGCQFFFSVWRISGAHVQLAVAAVFQRAVCKGFARNCMLNITQCLPGGASFERLLRHSHKNQ
jgi:hypothetical protein